MDIITHNWIFLLVILLGFLEAVILWKKKRVRFDWGEAMTTMFINLFPKVVGVAVILPALPLLDSLQTYSLFKFERTLIYWPLLFLVAEAGAYWGHRTSHRVKLFWLSHGIHHSSTQYTLFSGTRTFAAGLATFRWIFICPAILVGFKTYDLVAMIYWMFAVQTFLHTELIGTLGPLEKFLMTPSNHRVHHSLRPEHRNKNFGCLTVIYDKLFGTYAAEGKRVDCYGLGGHEANSKNPLSPFIVVWAGVFANPDRHPAGDTSIK